MSQFKINSITDKSGYCGPVIAGVSTNNSTGCMIIPAGPTEHRGGRGRAIFGSGATPTSVNVMDSVEIATIGNAVDFGDDIIARTENYGSCASSTRGLFAGGYNTATTAEINTISYVTISSQGGIADFGSLSGSWASYSDGGYYGLGGVSDSTRGLFGGGQGPSSLIHYVTIATTGDASNFGDLTVGRAYALGGISNGTRGIIGGGMSPTQLSSLDFVTIQTTGNATHFGDMTTIRTAGTGLSNSTRGITAGGSTPTKLNSIDYITIATEGNAVDFGDFTHSGSGGGANYLGSAASSTRGLIAGGQTPTKLNSIEYITIATTGNATDFGDLTVARRFNMGLSDVNGGLG
mgnify:CR=1 FL=1